MRGLNLEIVGGNGGSVFSTTNRLKEGAFKRVVLETLHEILGEASTETLVRIIGAEVLYEPDLLAKKLSEIFGGGTGILLHEIELACDVGGNVS